MKKRLACLVLTVLMLCAVSGTVLADDTYADSFSLPQNALEGSMQLLYAKMQLEMSALAREQAIQSTERIAALQQEQRQVAAFLSSAKQLRLDAETYGNETEIPADMSQYLSANGFANTTGETPWCLSVEEWNLATEVLESRLESVGLETQQQMVLLQNYLGQYNMQQQNTNQLLTSLARGQSMYGNSEVGLALTALVLGLVLGCAMTLVVLKMRKKKDAA